jgi:DnaK suppressor protein
MSTTPRYSDEQLAAFRDLIDIKLEQARAEHGELVGALQHDGNGTDDTYRSSQFLEESGDELQREETAHMASRQLKFIQELEAALVRIKNGTYGICRITGELIPEARLRLVPHTTLSMQAKNGPTEQAA